jgi:TrmH family RNA methyltransferase
MRSRHLRLVLVAPRTPGNVGACARLAANFGVDDWVIVAPQCSWDGWDAKKLATGDAGKRLDAVRVVDTVAEAVADCQAAVGFSRRVGKIRASTIGLDEAAGTLGGRVALVFGNEETGLTREELEPCTHLCTIPTDPGLASMNLSHAVAVGLARFYAAPKAATPARSARLAELQGLLGHWREFLVDAGMDRGGNPDRILVTLRAIFERASLNSQEIRALRGVLSKTQVRIGTRKRGKRV